MNAVNCIFDEYNELYKEEPDPDYSRRKTSKRRKVSIKPCLQGKNVAPADLSVLLGLAVALDQEPFMEMYGDGMEASDGGYAPGVNTFWGSKRFYNLQRRKRVGSGELLREEVLEVRPLEGELLTA